MTCRIELFFQILKLGVDNCYFPLRAAHRVDYLKKLLDDIGIGDVSLGLGRNIDIDGANGKGDAQNGYEQEDNEGRFEVRFQSSPHISTPRRRRDWLPDCSLFHRQMARVPCVYDFGQPGSA